MIVVALASLGGVVWGAIAYVLRLSHLRWALSVMVAITLALFIVVFWFNWDFTIAWKVFFCTAVLSPLCGVAVETKLRSQLSQ